MIDHEIRRYGVQFICLKLETATASNLKGSHWFGRNGYTDTIKSLIQALRIVRLWNCAGIYVYHADRANCMTIGLLVNKLLRKPLFVVVHDDAGKGRDTVSLRRLFSSELSIGRQPKLAIAKTLAAWMKRIGVRWAEACFCPSFSTARYVRDDLHARRVVVSRNGVEMPQGYPRSPKRFDGIFVGRVDPLKGIDVLVSAWKIVTSKKPNARLVIVAVPAWNYCVCQGSNPYESGNNGPNNARQARSASPNFPSRSKRIASAAWRSAARSFSRAL